MRAGQVVAHRLPVRQGAESSGEPVDVDDLVDQQVGVACEPGHVLALAGVAREHHRAARGVEPEAERREHRGVLHEHRAHLHTPIVLGIDDDRLHRRRRRCGTRAVGHDAEIDVGDVGVARHADLVHSHRLSHVLASLVGDAEVDVVGEGPEHVVERRTSARRGLVGEDQRRVGVGWEHRDREAGRTGPVHVDDVRRPAPHEEVGQVDDVVAVEVGEEDRSDDRPGAVEAGVDPDARAPHLPMGALAAIDDVRRVTDDDRVGVSARGRLRVSSASRAEEHPR